MTHFKVDERDLLFLLKEQLGYEPEQYLENPDFWWRCVHPDDRASVEAHSAQLFRKGRAAVSLGTSTILSIVLTTRKGRR